MSEIHNQNNIEKKYKYVKRYSKDFSAVRSACLFVVKALSKLVDDMHNKVYFDFDKNGLILRATDKDSLDKAQNKLEQWKDYTQIGILIDHIDKEDYKRFIDNELQTLWKKEKAFINVISYDKFYTACEYLEKKGYSEPLQKYQQIQNENKNFSLLMCTKHKFEEIKERIYDLLKPLQKEITQQKKKASAPQPQKNNRVLHKPMTWDEEDSDSINDFQQHLKNEQILEKQNSSQNNQLQSVNILSVNSPKSQKIQKESSVPFNSIDQYDDSFPDINGQPQQQQQQQFPTLDNKVKNQHNQQNQQNNQHQQNFHHQHSHQVQSQHNKYDQHGNSRGKVQSKTMDNNQNVKQQKPNSENYNSKESSQSQSYQKPSSQQRSQKQPSQDKPCNLINIQDSSPSDDGDGEQVENKNKNSNNNKNNYNDYNDNKEQGQFKYFKQQNTKNILLDQAQNEELMNKNSFQFQIKKVIWLIYSGVLNDNILNKTCLTQDEDEQDTYVDINVDKQTVNNFYQSKNQQISQQQIDYEVESIKRYLYDKERYAEQLQMKIIQKHWPIEVYQFILKTNFFASLFAQQNKEKQGFDLFHSDIFKNTVNKMRQNLIKQMAANYLLQKMHQKKNFLFLVASRKEFANIQIQLKQYFFPAIKEMPAINGQQAKEQQQQQQQMQQNNSEQSEQITSQSISPYFIDIYQNVFDQFPVELTLNHIKEITQKFSSSNKLGPRDSLQEYYKKQPETAPYIILNQNKQYEVEQNKYFIKKIERSSERQLLEVCKNLRLQTFYQSDFIIQQYGVRVVDQNLELQNNQQLQQIQQFNLYIFFEHKKKNLGKLISQNLLHNNIEEQIKLSLKIIEGLKFLHTHALRPICHGNLKFDNILFDEKLDPYFTDIVTQLQESRFLAPEFQKKYQKMQKNSQQSISGNSIKQEIDEYMFMINYSPTLQGDIWNLGLILYSIFTGDIQDTHSFISSSKGKIQQIMLDNQANSNKNKKIYKQIMQLIDEITNISPQNRPDIIEIKNKIGQIQQQLK